MKEKDYERIVDGEVSDSIIILNSKDADVVQFENYLKDKCNIDFYNTVIYEIKELEKFYDKASTFALVGCGHLPLTLFAYYSKFPDSIFVGLDKNENAITSSKKLAKHFKLKNVSFYCCTGEGFDFSKIKTILIVGMVKNKTEVLKRISATAPVGAKIFIRCIYEEDYRLKNDKYLRQIGNLKKIYEIDKNLFLGESPYALMVLEKT